ncbi:MAG TPA: hypothetical protein VF063_01500 [Gaiellaceae bacterium]
MLKLFVSIATLAAALALGTAAPSAASSTPCWKVVVSDWYADGRIDNTYPLHCYQDALRHLPPDVRAYADASDEIQRAMQAAIRDSREKLDQASAAPHSKRDEPQAFSGGSGGGGGGEPPKGFLSRWIDWLGPKNAGSVPLPLLVIASIALLLLAAASASFVARRIQARRVVPAPAPAPPPKRS